MYESGRQRNIVLNRTKYVFLKKLNFVDVIKNQIGNKKYIFARRTK